MWKDGQRGSRIDQKEFPGIQIFNPRPEIVVGGVVSGRNLLASLYHQPIEVHLRYRLPMVSAP